MKKIILFAGIFLFFTACKKSFLQVDPKAIQLEDRYYKTSEQVFNALVATYDPLAWEGGNVYANFLVFVAGADECYSGGGSSSDLPFLQPLNNYTIDPATGPHGDFWQQYFTGVARANNFLAKIQAPEISGLSDSLRGRYTAEAKTIRAYFYFNLVRLFKNIPMYLVPLEKSEIYNQQQVAPEIVYAQIEKDLQEAIAEKYLPNTVAAATEGGRITKGAAKALLGKVYLYEKKWTDAAAQFADVNGTPGSSNIYGYRLYSNFNDIFKPDNKFTSESIWEFSHNAKSAGTTGNPQPIEGLMATVMVGPRSYTGDTFVFGWGGCPIIPAFTNLMRTDPRYSITVSDIDSLVALKKATYAPGYLNTGKFVRKYAPLKAFRPASGGNPVANYPQNYIEMRVADAYLMEAEAILQSGGNTGRAALLLNAVRARVGLPAITATLDNIYNERRFELATEGHRWHDLVRWGQAPTVLAFKGFKSGKNEIFPIPLNELNNTKLEQNPGYK